MCYMHNNLHVWPPKNQIKLKYDMKMVILWKNRLVSATISNKFNISCLQIVGLNMWKIARFVILICRCCWLVGYTKRQIPLISTHHQQSRIHWKLLAIGGRK